MVHKERKIDKIKIYKLLILLLFLSNIFSYPITKKYTYSNDIVFFLTLILLELWLILKFVNHI